MNNLSPNTKFNYLRQCFQNNNSHLEALSWSEFNQNQTNNVGRKVFLNQKDFNNGTLRILASCWIQLAENISFNPNRGFGYKTVAELKGLGCGHNWFPTIEQLKTDYDRHAYRLGFFAAITIETKDVWIDLNRFTLEQSQEHRLMQRFFALIELADQPFLPLTGPSNFGDTLDSASNVIISNGTMGLSSHHGVHGNSNTDILFQSLIFKNYEVAAISMNGCKQVFVDKVELLGNDTNVPVLGTFSSLRFLDQFTIEALKLLNCNKSKLEAKLKLSKLAQQQIYYSVIKNGKKLKCVSKKIYKSINENFINSDGLVDGNVYGLLFNKPSVAVNSFTEQVDTYVSQNVSLHDVKIDNTICKIKEIVVLNHMVEDKLKAIVDTAGSVLQIDKIVNKDGTYKYSILSDYKMTLSNEVRTLTPEYQKHFGTLYIPEELYNWSQSDLPITKFIKYGQKNGCYVRTRNSDTMNHMNKGVLGLRVDGVDGLYLHNVEITNTTNKGESGIDDVIYYDSSDGGHVEQSGNEPNRGYLGADARAIGLFSVKNINFSHVDIKNVTSYYGKNIGIDLQGRSDGQFDSVYVDYLKSEYKNYDKLVCGIRVGKNVNMEFKETFVSNFHIPNGILYIINNNNTTITQKNEFLDEFDLTWWFIICFFLVIFILILLYYVIKNNTQTKKII